MSEGPSLPAQCRALRDLPGALLVDDFEDGDALLETKGGLHGLWYVENDRTGEQSPPAGEQTGGALLAAPGAPTSAGHALHTTASGFRSWGAFVGVRLNATASRACTVDVSASRGLAFTARGQNGVRVNFASPVTTPVGDGGECDAAACSDYGAVIDLGDDWRRFELNFDELRQPDWAAAAEWQPERLVRLSFWAEQSGFQLWLDEVRFF
jgi:hypothetical protein